MHHANRIEQRNAIREQVELLNWLSSSAGAYDRRFLPERARPQWGEERRIVRWRSRPGIKDLLKHRWNEEVEKLMRKACEMRWEDGRNVAVEGWKAAVRLVRRRSGES